MSTKQDKQSMCNQSARARMKGVKDTLTLNDWLAIKLAHNYQCAYCGSEAELVPDHILAIARGGENTPENINPSCRQCNSEKQDKTLEEWRAGLSALRQYGRKAWKHLQKNSAENTLQTY